MRLQKQKKNWLKYYKKEEVGITIPTSSFFSYFIVDYASSRAATPGNTLPSINSNDAPPPVET